MQYQTFFLETVDACFSKQIVKQTDLKKMRFSPVKTTFPETKIRRTILGLTIL